MTRRGKHETGIGWTHVDGYIGGTWNPTTGCARVSPGCDHCYAFTLHDQRYSDNLHAARAVIADPEQLASWLAYRARHTSAVNDGPLLIAWVRENKLAKLHWPAQYDVPFSTVQMLDDHRLRLPMRKQAPHCYFVDSMADLFNEDVPFEFIDRVFAVMALTPRHLYQILTKRPERMREYMLWSSEAEDMDRAAMVEDAADTLSHSERGSGFELRDWPLPNVWLGTSTEDQQRADERIPILLDTPAVVRFISAEPLLGVLDLRQYLSAGWLRSDNRTIDPWNVPPLDWVIVGGESGSPRRDMDDDWARSMRDQCVAAGVAFYFKQSSAFRSGYDGPPDLQEARAFPVPR